MNTISFEKVVRHSAISSINGYQKYISAKKGFACPHRRLHGGLSCSDYVKNVLSAQDLSEVVKLSYLRFKDCARASKSLQNGSSGGCIVVPCCIPL